LRTKKRLLYCAAYLSGQHGVNGTYVGVPVIAGAGGLQGIAKIERNDDDKAMFDPSVKAVKELVEITQAVLVVRLSVQPPRGPTPGEPRNVVRSRPGNVPEFGRFRKVSSCNK
jgi:hypothetical protein